MWNRSYIRIRTLRHDKRSARLHEALLPIGISIRLKADGIVSRFIEPERKGMYRPVKRLAEVKLKCGCDHLVRALLHDEVFIGRVGTSPMYLIDCDHDEARQE